MTTRWERALTLAVLAALVPLAGLLWQALLTGTCALCK